MVLHSSSLDKARLFAKMFSSNSNLDDSGDSLPDCPILTNIKISNLNITSLEVTKFIRKLETSKAVGPDQIPVVVLKHLAPELKSYLGRWVGIYFAIKNNTKENT